MSPARALLAAAAILGSALLLGAPGSPPRAGPDAGPRRLLLDKDAAYARHAGPLARGGLRVLADYGSFVLVEIQDEARAATIAATGVHVRRHIPDGVRLRRRTIRRSDAVAGVGREPEGAREDLRVIRFSGPPRADWIDALRALPGSRVLMTLPEDAYVVWVPREGRDLLPGSGLPIDIDEPLDPSDRVSPDLDDQDGPLAVTLLFVDSPEGAAAAAAAADRGLGRAAFPPRLDGFITAVLTLPREDLEEIASWPQLVWAEPFEPPSRHDELSSLITAGLVEVDRPLGPNYRQWLAQHGFGDLSSWVVQIMDTGIDTGGLGAEHPSLAGRLAFATDETGEGSVEDCVGHGTHLAGIIAGDPPPSADFRDDEGYEFGLGVAPTARVGSSRIFNCIGIFGVNRSFTAIFSEAYAHGARVSNNSWGAGGASYTAFAREFDAAARDVNADPNDGDQPMVIVASAGNNGAAGLRTIQSPGLAKNAISVGATESYRPSGTDGCGVGPAASDDAGEIRVTSSRGPTVDGRLKPDLVAPGTHIMSGTSRSESYSGLGLCDKYYPRGQRLYSWTGGTSQAAGHVSGAAVLVMAHHQRVTGSIPSPAMVRAKMIAAARDLGRGGGVGAGSIPHRPTFEQGWGRVDVRRLIESRHQAAYDQATTFTSAGQEVVEGPFRVADPNRPVSVVLAWTDAPGTPAGSAWVNDLDLEVVSGSTTFLGNVLDDGASVPGGGHDPRNNTEAVFLASPSTAAITVKVTAVSIPGDGVPSHPGLTDQDFALYLDNVIDGGSPGEIFLDRDACSCAGTTAIVVVDRHLAGAGSLRVDAASGTEALPESVDLVEDPPGSAIFRGTIRLEPGAPARDGAVQVADGDRLEVAYQDRDGGAGMPATRRAEAGVLCEPVAISGVAAEPVGTDRVVVSWTTSRPADSTVEYGSGALVHDDALVTRHRVVLTGLAACASYPYRVSSRDATGVSTSFPASGSLSAATGGAGRVSILAEDFEGAALGWRHEGAGDEWELGFPAAGPGAAASGSRAWGTDLDGEYDAAADVSLISPAIDLRGRPGATLSIQHFVDIPTAVAGNPQDGAWVEVSIDGGATWSPIAPTTGYPYSEGPNNPYLPTGSGVYAETFAAWRAASFDLASFQGKVIRLRFRLWRDPLSTSPPGTGWYIDDVVVSAPAACHRALILFDSDAYGCSGVARVTVADTDLDVDSSRRDAVSVLLSSGAGSIGLLLTETSPASGEFTGAAFLSPSAASGKLAVSEGDTLTARVTDADDGTGSPATAEAHASVPDCTPPAPPADLVVRSDAEGQLRLEWTDPPAGDLDGVRVHYDSDAPGPAYAGQGALQGASPVRAEMSVGVAILSGLPRCVPQFVTVTAVDALGNESAFAAEAVGVPRGPGPCAHANLSLAPSEGAGCAQDVAVRLDDADADSNPGAPGAALVTATSPSDASPLEVALTETGASTGTFLGTLPLSPVPAAGRLAVSAGDEVEVVYADANPAGGAPVPHRIRLPVDDCSPPVVSDLQVSFLGFGRIGLEWNTDEAAASTVEYGLDPGLGQTIVNAAMSTHHVVLLTGLPPCATVHYRVLVSDRRGNVGIADDAGIPFHAGTARTLALLDDDFESGAPGWTHAGAMDEWELGSPVVGPPGAWSGTSVWGTDLDGHYEAGADMMLTSPEIDLAGVDSAELVFRHWYSVYTSHAGSGLDDGAWVEVSRNGGLNWTYVAPVGGYTDKVALNPYLGLGTPVYAGQSNGWEEAVFNLDAFASEKIRIRFHLYQDVVDVSNVTRPGWYLDDVEVRIAAACRHGRVRLDAADHDCGGGPIIVRLWDENLDGDVSLPGTATVRVTSPTDPTPLDVLLTETGAATGLFTGAAPFDAAGGPGALRVSEADLVEAVYHDADDGTGAPAISSATTRIGDCTAPVLTGLRTRALSDTSAVVEWETDEPASSEVELSGTGVVFASTTPSTRHSITVTGLAPCVAQPFEASSADGGGNRATVAGGSLTLGGRRRIAVLREGFEAGAPGWSHGGVFDEWEVGAPVVGPPGAFEGSSVAGTDLDGVYGKDPDRQTSASYLVSPSFGLAGLEAAELSIRHWFEFVPGTRGDGAIVEAWDGGRWVSLEPLGGYPRRLRTDRSGTLVGAFTDASGGWAESRFSLAAYAGRATRLRFRMILDSGTPGAAPGWYIDDVAVTGLASCRRGILLLDRGSYACGPDSPRITVADLDLDLDAASVDSASVEASAGSSSVVVPLLETGIATGVFSGVVPFSAAGGPAALAPVEGETLSVTYVDADDGSGAPASTVASAPVSDCRPPAVSDVRVERVENGSGLLLRFRTDEPAESKAVLAIPGRAPEVLSSSDHATDHAALFTGLPECAAFSLSLSAADATGNRTDRPGAAPPLAGETTRRRTYFFDDMEGADPGWQSLGVASEWERGVPEAGPPGAFSGVNVFGTDLDGTYQGGTDAIARSPQIDLRTASSARLSFWHWYDVFADGSPNADDDGAWVELFVAGATSAIYLQPVDGYTNTIDRDAGPPISGGSGVYAGQSVGWRRSVFDLTPYAGKQVLLRFRIWNDVLEGIFNKATGLGWYLDDVLVSGPDFCSPPPLLLSADSGGLVQGAAAVSLEVAGSGLRGPLALDAGPGLTIHTITVVDPGRATALVDVAGSAAAGPRDLIATGPDGQSSTLQGALLVEVAASRADVDGSGAVDGRDLEILAHAFGSLAGEARYRNEADVNGDGAVDGADLAVLGAQFGRVVGP